MEQWAIYTVYVQIFEARNFHGLLFPSISRKQFSRIASFRYGILKFRELNFRELLESAKTAKITFPENLDVYGSRLEIAVPFLEYR